MERIDGEPVGQREAMTFMADNHPARRTEKSPVEARGGVTGNNVRYVLAASLLGVIIFFAGLLYFWSA